jgi:MYXO-CTERM domain-containing protein
MNMTPTCVCDQGFVAVGGMDASGVRQMNCVEPAELVPATFYQTALPALPEALPGGREVALTDPQPMLGVEPDPTNGEPAPDPVMTASFPMPRSNPALPGSETFTQIESPRSSSSGCSVPAGGGQKPTTFLSLLAALGLVLSHRRRA